MTERRLDDLVAQLASTRPRLDDLTRARVASRIEAAKGSPVVAPRRRWPLVFAGAVAAAAALALVLRGGGRSEPPVAPTNELTATAAAPVRGELAGAAITLYGPGWAREEAGRIVVEAETVIVDRATAATPLELVVGGKTTIRALAATFAVDARVMRITAIRGDLLVRCDGDDTARAVVAGDALTCAARIAKQDGAATHAGDPPAPPAVADRGPAPPVADRGPAPPVADRGPTVPAAARGPAPPAADRGPAPPAVADRGFPAPAADRGPAPPAVADRGPVASVPPAIERPAPRVVADKPIIDAPAPRGVDEQPARTVAAPSTTAPERVETATEPVNPPLPSPEERYARAERLITSDPKAARAALRELVATAPGAAVAAPAWLDLARLAIAAGDPVAAQAALDRLADHPGRVALAMPAAHLRCQIDGTASCLARFRDSYPGSPHDADVLARLATTTAATDCGAARPLIAEYLRRYPQGSARAAVTAWRDRCR